MGLGWKKTLREPTPKFLRQVLSFQTRSTEPGSPGAADRGWKLSTAASDAERKRVFFHPSPTFPANTTPNRVSPSILQSKKEVNKVDPNTFPTKGNLILAKNSLALSRQGYDLMDKKRNILIRELMDLIAEATDIQQEIDETFSSAYRALQKANIQMGIHEVEQVSLSVPVEDSIRIKRRSVMGTEIPKVEYDRKPQKPAYSFYGTKISLDEACAQFQKVKELTIRLAEIENSAYRLAYNIKKTQKRANALQNITIPKFEKLAKEIQEYLEEKEREDFTRLKVIKKMKGR